MERTYFFLDLPCLLTDGDVRLFRKSVASISSSEVAWNELSSDSPEGGGSVGAVGTVGIVDVFELADGFKNVSSGRGTGLGPFGES